MGDLVRIDGLHHRAQSHCFLPLIAVLGVLRKVGEHHPAYCRTDSIAADDEIAGGDRPVFELERDRAGRGGLGV